MPQPPSEKDPSAISETRGNVNWIRDPDNGYSRTPGDLPVGAKNTSPLPPTNGVGGTTVPDIAGGLVGNELQEGGDESSNEKDEGPAPAYGSAMPDDSWCLTKARDIYTNSRNYIEANITLNWERDLITSVMNMARVRRIPVGIGAEQELSTQNPSQCQSPRSGPRRCRLSTADYLQISPFDQSDPSK